MNVHVMALWSKVAKMVELIRPADTSAADTALLQIAAALNVTNSKLETLARQGESGRTAADFLVAASLQCITDADVCEGEGPETTVQAIGRGLIPNVFGLYSCRSVAVDDCHTRLNRLKTLFAWGSESLVSMHTYLTKCAFGDGGFQLLKRAVTPRSTAPPPRSTTSQSLLQQTILISNVKIMGECEAILAQRHTLFYFSVSRLSNDPDRL